MIKLNEIFKRKNILPAGKLVHKRKRKVSKWVLYSIIGLFAFFILGFLFEGGDDDSESDDGEFMLKRKQPQKIVLIKKEIPQAEVKAKEVKALEIKKEEQKKPYVEYLDSVLKESKNNER
jgi:hypothetical protein